MVFLGKIMSISNRQHLFEAQFTKMLSNTEAELKKCFAYEKGVYFIQ